MSAGTAPSAFDEKRLLALLDMEKMTLSSAPRSAQGASERWMRYLGFPGGIAAFLLLYFLPFGPSLSGAAQAGIACFVLALIWWVTEPFPTYASAVLAASIFHFGTFTIREAKEHMAAAAIPMRLA